MNEQNVTSAFYISIIMLYTSARLSVELVVKYSLLSELDGRRS